MAPKQWSHTVDCRDTFYATMVDVEGGTCHKVATELSTKLRELPIENEGKTELVVELDQISSSEESGDELNEWWNRTTAKLWDWAEKNHVWIQLI